MSDAARTPLSLRDAIVIIAVALVFFLPGFQSLPVVDRDEARFAQASRQMLTTGDLIDIRYQDEARHKKPVGIYWLQAGSAKLFGDTIQSYRLPSLLGAIGAALMTGIIGAMLFGRAVGLAAGLLMAASFGLGYEARQAKSDAMLLFTILAAQAALVRLYVRVPEQWERKYAPFIFWAAMGAGVLIKGPIIVMISGLTIVGLVAADRSFDRFKPLWSLRGLGLFALIALPWNIAITIVTDGAFFAEAVGKDLLGKVAEAKESHGAPPGTYLGTVWAFLWPGAALLGFGLPFLWSHRKDDRVRFLIAWVLPAWIVFELTPTKLPHYTLPLFPALIIAGVAGFVAAENRGWTIWRRVASSLAALVAIGVGLLLAFAPAYAWNAWPAGNDVPGNFVLSLVVIAAGVVAAYTLVRGWHEWAPVQTLGAVLVSSFVLYGIGFGTILPSLSPLWLSPRLEAMIETHTPRRCKSVMIASAGYHEPSLVFQLGTETLLTDARGAAEFLRDQNSACAFALVDIRQGPQFGAVSIAETIPVQAIDSVAGFNYSKGREMEIGLYRLKP